MATYHRRESPTQTPEDARKQTDSLEIWGGPSRYSDVPRVRAYIGPLPNEARGIEFETWVSPDADGPPGQAQWSGPRNGVMVYQGMARLNVDEVRNRQLEEDS